MKIIGHLSLILAEVINNTTSDLEGIQVSSNSLAKVIMDDRIALGFLMVGQDRVCVIANTSICSWAKCESQ